MVAMVKKAFRKDVSGPWSSSLCELSAVRALSFCGVMMALAMVLGIVGTIRITPFLKIGISSYPNQIVDYLFGPAVGALFAGCMDILKYITLPDGMFFPGFTVSALLEGLIYGYAFYRRPVTFRRVFAAHAIAKVFITAGLNTYWLMILTGKAVEVLMFPRLITAAVRIPVDSLLCWLILKTVRRVAPALFPGWKTVETDRIV